MAGSEAREQDATEGLEYDFFIAHAGGDTAMAETLYERLSTNSRPFLDARCLLPGDDWDVELARAQRASRITVVLVSAQTDAAFYHREEIATALALSRSDPESHRVVPIVLPGWSDDRMPYGLRVKHRLSLQGSGSIDAVVDQLLDLLLQIARRSSQGVYDQRSSLVLDEHFRQSRHILTLLRTLAYDRLIDIDIHKELQREIVRDIMLKAVEESGADGGDADD